MINVIKNDIRYQIKYGFYFLYLFITALYIGILFVMPDQYKEISASIIVLTDPAMLGFFFIGGIWLLERGEGLHRFYSISPLKPLEYILSKALSLSIISTLSALGIVILGLHKSVNYPIMLLGILIGSMTFTLLGLTIATFAPTLNNYLLISIPIEVFIFLPPVLKSFGIKHAILDVFPGTILWELVNMSFKKSDSTMLLKLLSGMVLWLLSAVVIALFRIPAALHRNGGEKE